MFSASFVTTGTRRTITVWISWDSIMSWMPRQELCLSRPGNRTPRAAAAHTWAQLLDALKTLHDPEDKNLTDGASFRVQTLSYRHRKDLGMCSTYSPPGSLILGRSQALEQPALHALVSPPPGLRADLGPQRKGTPDSHWGFLRLEPSA